MIWLWHVRSTYRVEFFANPTICGGNPIETLIGKRLFTAWLVLSQVFSSIGLTLQLCLETTCLVQRQFGCYQLWSMFGMLASVLHSWWLQCVFCILILIMLAVSFGISRSSNTGHLDWNFHVRFWEHNFRWSLVLVASQSFKSGLQILLFLSSNENYSKHTHVFTLAQSARRCRLLL